MTKFLLSPPPLHRPNIRDEKVPAILADHLLDQYTRRSVRPMSIDRLPGGEPDSGSDGWLWRLCIAYSLRFLRSGKLASFKVQVDFSNPNCFPSNSFFCVIPNKFLLLLLRFPYLLLFLLISLDQHHERSSTDVQLVHLLSACVRSGDANVLRSRQVQDLRQHDLRFRQLDRLREVL